MMINSINRIAPLLLVLALSGCFKDKGNYDYKELNAPTWGFDPDKSPIYVTTVVGDTAKSKPEFRFEQDSVETLKHLRYEWKYNGILLSADRNLHIAANDLAKLINEPSNKTSEGISGTYTIIDTRTDIKHMARTLITIKPAFDLRDWLILSENGANAKLSFYKRKALSGQVIYTLRDNLYETVNKTPLLGRPVNLRYAQAKAISAPVGATTIITSQGAITLNNETFERVNNLTDEFLDAVPSNFEVSNIFHSRLVSYVATVDGRLFRKVMSENQLGGKFISEPYTIDGKGYKITDFGIGKTRQWGTVSPVYDELNRRVMMIKMAPPYSIIPVRQLAGVEIKTPIANMPEGTEIIYFGAAAFEDISYQHDLYTMVYNDKNGNTFLSDFVIDQQSATYVDSPVNGTVAFPGGNIQRGTKFLGTADGFRGKQNHLFYTNGDELRVVDRRTDDDKSYMRFSSKITAIKYAGSDSHNAIGLGFENGDFLLIDVKSIDAPKVIEHSKVNVGGKVTEIMEYRNDFSTDAY